MSRAVWQLYDDRPVVDVVLRSQVGRSAPLRLLADTGAGSLQAGFEMILETAECLAFGQFAGRDVNLDGAFQGIYPLFTVEVKISQLGFVEVVPVAAATGEPDGFKGVAGFRFLNRFSYGNFGNPDSFGLEI